MSDTSSSSENEDFSDNEAGKRKLSAGKKNASKKRKKELLKPPTTEELNQLRETENLYSSNLMRLQIEEVLSEISVKQAFLDKIDDWWNHFLKLINNLGDEEKILLSELTLHSEKKLNKKLKFLDELLNKKTNLVGDRDFPVKFLPPESCTTFGEYQLKCLSKTDMHLNIDIKMPAGCFSTKDYLNNRYFIKRHYYLLYILGSIRKKVPASKMEILLYQNLDFFPFIQIVPDFSDKIKINVFVTASEIFFNLNRFLPDKNNIKYDFDNNFEDIQAKDFATSATPIHNSFIVRDCTLDTNYRSLEESLNVKNIQDAIRLLKLWLTQRQLIDGFGNFTTELIFYTVAYLEKKKKINSHMSSYQVVRIFWSFIKDSNWHEEPISLCDDVKTDIMDMFKMNYDVVFLDITGCFNVASFIHFGVYLKLKQEAKLAVSILDGNKFNAFSSLFLVKVPFTLQFDALIMLNDDNNFKVIYQNIDTKKKWKYYGFYNELIINEISDILKQGFGNRLVNIVPYIHVGDSDNNTNTTSRIIIGINLNPEFAFNVIERGPSEENPPAVKEFQKFWQGLSSFRRFKDSTVAEVVYFHCRTLQDKRNIFTKILEFLFTKKYPLNMKIIGNQFEKALKLEKTIIHFPTGTNEEACLKVKHMYNDLNKILRSLELPLFITNVQGTSDVFSYTEVFPPVPTTYKMDKNLLQQNGNKFLLKSDIETLPRYVSPIQCVIEMGKSSGWPDDLTVLQCMKCEFYIRLSELLGSKHNILSSVTLDHLDIFYEGVVFRFRLFVPKELVLLKKSVDNEGVISYKDNEESLMLERDMEILPKVTSALSGVYQQYPSFGPCCALIKRWLRSQMIDVFHISDTVINLWNASLYLNDPPYPTPHLPQVAFLRFLNHLKDFDWKLNPIIVNFNDDISNTALHKLEAEFQQNRNNHPNLYIITPYDQDRSVFSKVQPSKHVLKRIRVLASETYKFLDKIILKWENLPIKDIFQPNLQGYDVLIYLKSSINPMSYQSITTNNTERDYIERYDKSVSNSVPVIDFNPVNKYIRELRVIYGDYVIFFYDPYGGNVIGMLWNRQTVEQREFKVQHVNGKKLVDGKLGVNYDAILEDICNRGHGLITNIEKKK